MPGAAVSLPHSRAGKPAPAPPHPAHLFSLAESNSRAELGRTLQAGGPSLAEVEPETGRYSKADVTSFQFLPQNEPII